MALCTGPNQMKIASYLCPLTYSLMVITYPLSYPIAIVMDKVIGIQGKTRYSNNDLRELIKLHTINAIKEFEPDEEIKKNEIGLSNEQVQLMIGALDIKTEKVKQIMIPLKDCEMMEYNTIINEEFLRNLMIKGYSRIPIYINHRNNVVGILRMKQLLGVHPSENLRLEDLHLELTNPFIVSEEMKAIDLLNEFRKGMSHMAFISNKLSKSKIEFHSIGKNNSNNSHENSNDEQSIIGIVTLEDIIEKMFNVDILDEEDYKKKKEKMLEKEKIKRELSHKIIASFIKENKEQLNDMIEKSHTIKNNLNQNMNLNDGDYGLFEDHNYFN
jgi:CBS domain containing-hemolysin-like protein